MEGVWATGGYGSLEEALTIGTGLERSYVCQAHDDHTASASVNSVSGLFICYTCGHKGKVDLDKIVVTAEGVQQFVSRIHKKLNPNSDRYSETWLNMFDSNGPGDYWLSRYTPEAAKFFRLGQTPTTATYPMRDNQGEVMGVVTRDLTGTDRAKYRYPSDVQVAQYLIDYHRVETDDIVLVEGMSDVVAAYETGHHATLGCYKAGLSSDQVKLLRKYAPRTVYVAFDMDTAGNEGAEKVRQKLSWFTKVKRLWWQGYKDIAAIPLESRKAMFDQILDNNRVTALAR